VKRIFFISRSFYPYETGGGPIVRKKQVEFLEKEGFDVIVVKPNYLAKSNKIEGNIHQIGVSEPTKWTYKKMSLGLVPDYLDEFYKKATVYLEDKVKESDILFCTTGGEISCFRIGYALKKKLKSKLVLNYHDPISYTSVFGVFQHKQMVRKTEKLELKMLQAADSIITSTKSQQKYLEEKSKTDKSKFRTVHFGYFIDTHTNNKVVKAQKLVFGYGGAMGDAQRIESLVALFAAQDKHELWLFGNFREKEKYTDSNSIKFHDPIPLDEYIKVFTSGVDIGIVSLANQYYAVCTPSKLYDYLAWGMPVLGYLHNGEAREIILDNHFGASLFPNPTLEEFDKTISLFEDENRYHNFKINIEENKLDWSLYSKWKPVSEFLKEL
jgi:hypothetical protein